MLPAEEAVLAMIRRVLGLTVALAVLPFFPGVARTQSGKPSSDFHRIVQPFLARNCTPCHNGKMKASSLDLEALNDATAALARGEVWEKVFEKLRAGQMPPPGRPARRGARGASMSRARAQRRGRTLRPPTTARRL